MKVSLNEICRDFLSLRGESPDLLPILEEGEDSAVLMLSRQLEAAIPMTATEATCSLPPLMLETATKLTGKFSEISNKFGKLYLPEGYLKLVSVKLYDWEEPVRATESENSLRRELGANAPSWMICRHNPMVTEERDEKGRYLKVYGSDAFEEGYELVYVPNPEFTAGDLTISRSAYFKMLKILNDSIQ